MDNNQDKMMKIVDTELDGVTGGTKKQAAKYIREVLGLSKEEYNEILNSHGGSDDIFLQEMTVRQQQKYWRLLRQE